MLCFDTTRVKFFRNFGFFFQYFLSLFFKREFREKSYSISKMLIPEKWKLIFTQPVWVVKMCFDISSCACDFFSRGVYISKRFWCLRVVSHESLGPTNRWQTFLIAINMSELTIIQSCFIFFFQVQFVVSLTWIANYCVINHNGFLISVQVYQKLSINKDYFETDQQLLITVINWTENSYRLNGNHAPK